MKPNFYLLLACNACLTALATAAWASRPYDAHVAAMPDTVEVAEPSTSDSCRIEVTTPETIELAPSAKLGDSAPESLSLLPIHDGLDAEFSRSAPVVNERECIATALRASRGFFEPTISDEQFHQQLEGFGRLPWPLWFCGFADGTVVFLRRGLDVGPCEIVQYFTGRVRGIDCDAWYFDFDFQRREFCHFKALEFASAHGGITAFGKVVD